VQRDRVYNLKNLTPSLRREIQKQFFILLQPPEHTICEDCYQIVPGDDILAT
jgi:hypothetical protein